jgi:thioesterase domain-containing protein
MDPDQPFYGIQAQGLDGKRPRHVSVEEMAAHYIGEIRAFQPRGPYFFGGSSFGGLVAYEMARQLHALGEQVAFLGLFDTNAPGYPRYLSARGSLRRRMERLAFRIDLHWSNFRVARGWEKVQYVGVKLQRLTIAQRRKAKRISKRLRRRVRERLLPSALRKVRDAGMQAFRSYEGKPYNGPVTLFRATVQPFGIHPDGTNGWNRFAQGELAIIDVPGHHGAIMREPRVKVLAAHLRAALATSETTAEDVR